MASFKRIISGTTAGLTRNFFNLIIILVSLPIYLSFWSLELYGIWVLIFSLVSLINLPTSNYLEYLQNEFLRNGTKNKLGISKIIFGSISIILLIKFFTLIIFLIIIKYYPNFEFININQKYFNILKISIFFLIASDIIACVVGVLHRALYPFNYYPKIQWIGLIIALLIPTIQIIGLFYGFEIIELSIATFVIGNLLNFFYLIYTITLVKEIKIKYKGFYFNKNLKHFFNSFYLLLGNVAHLLKNEGSRIVILPFVGTVQLVTYVTIRTANNFMKQLFSSFSNSFLIEYADNINKKNKKKFINSYKIYYLILNSLIAPIAFIFQIIASDLFQIWTKNKIEFDPILFASITAAFLIMIFYTPGFLVIQSKNLFKEDLKISIITSILFIISFMTLVNEYSIRGAGFALIFIELITGALIFYTSNKWLKKNLVKFNNKLLFISFLDLLISIIFIFLYAYNIDCYYLTLILLFIIYKSIFIIYHSELFNIRRYLSV